MNKQDKKDLQIAGIAGLGLAGLYLFSKNKNSGVSKTITNSSSITIPTTLNYTSAPTPISISLPTLSDFIKMNSVEINQLISEIENQLTYQISSKIDTSIVPEIAMLENTIKALETKIQEGNNALISYDVEIQNALNNRNEKKRILDSEKNKYLIYRNYVNVFTNSIQKSQAYYKSNQTNIELNPWWKISKEDYKKVIEFNSNYQSGQFETEINNRDVFSISFTISYTGIQRDEYYALEDIMEQYLQTYLTEQRNSETKMINAESDYNSAQNLYNSKVEAKTTFYKNNLEEPKVQMIAANNTLNSLKNSLYVSLKVLG